MALLTLMDQAKKNGSSFAGAAAHLAKKEAVDDQIKQHTSGTGKQYSRIFIFLS